MKRKHFLTSTKHSIYYYFLEINYIFDIHSNNTELIIKYARTYNGFIQIYKLSFVIPLFISIKKHSRLIQIRNNIIVSHYYRSMNAELYLENFKNIMTTTSNLYTANEFIGISYLIGIRKKKKIYTFLN